MSDFAMKPTAGLAWMSSEELFLVMGGDQDQLAAPADRRIIGEPLRHREPVLAAKVDVHERCVRPELVGETDRPIAGRRDTHDVDPLLLEKPAGSVEESGTIVHDQAAQ